MPEAPFRPLECVIGSSTLRVEYRDITTLNVDVIVSSDDTYLLMAGGVSMALRLAGGESVWREAQVQAPIELGNIAVTTAGQLNAERIFHAAVLDWAIALPSTDLIRRVTKKSLEACDRHGFRSIAFPALATGAAGLSPERSAVAMLLETAAYLNSPTNVQLVTIALYSAYLQRDVLRFYSQVSNFLELTQRLESINTALESLERVYRELGSEEAANITAYSRVSLGVHRTRWEEEISKQEPDTLTRNRGWLQPLEQMESDLDGISLLAPHTQMRQSKTEEKLERDWRQLERQYREERRGSLRALIAIWEKI